MDFTEFVEIYKEPLTERLRQQFPPLYTAELPITFPHDVIPRRPLGAQANAVKALTHALQTKKGVNVVGEMGTGKTYIAIATAANIKANKTIIICPPHMVRKWRREVALTYPHAEAVIVTSITQLQQLKLRQTNKPLFAIISREKAKLGSPRRSTSLERAIRNDMNPVKAVRYAGEITKAPVCPVCTSRQLDNDGVDIPDSDYAKKKLKCGECGEPLWQYTRSETGSARWPLAEYIKSHMRGFFDLFVGDEIHQYKAGTSAQGLAAGVLSSATKRSITLTGTFMGGRASSIFHLLYRFSDEIRGTFSHNDEQAWIQRYGFLERVTTWKDKQSEYGYNSNRRVKSQRTTEKPGIVPTALFHVIGNTVFLRLTDITHDLPTYKDHIIPIDLSNEPTETTISQAEAYEHLQEDLEKVVREELKNGSMKHLATYLQTLLSYPDASYKEEIILDEDQEVLAQAPAIPLKRFPKEEAMLEIVKDELKAGRRCILYVTHTDRRDITPRLDSIFKEEQIDARILKSTAVSADKREDWIQRAVDDGAQVLVVHPKNVETGLDLLHFPTIIWYEVDYSVYTVRQASRRSWRIGQTEPVNVYYMAYRNTLQEKAMYLIAAKMKHSLAVEGDLPTEGLSAYGAADEDIFMSLAKRIANQVDDEEELIELLLHPAEEIPEDEVPVIQLKPTPVMPAERPDALGWDEFLRTTKTNTKKGGSKLAKALADNPDGSKQLTFTDIS